MNLDVHALLLELSYDKKKSVSSNNIVEGDGDFGTCSKSHSW